MLSPPPPAPDHYLHKEPWVRAVVSIVCVLSIIGSVLIILSFLIYKDLRSLARRILVHISIVDLGVAVANLVGACVYFDKYYTRQPHDNCTLLPLTSAPSGLTPNAIVWCPQSLLIKNLCSAQASFAVYFTLASIFWSNGLSVYLYVRATHLSPKYVKYVYLSLGLFSYGFPVLIAVWLLFTGRLGYSPYESEGWCSIIMRDPSTHKRDFMAATFGYNIWIVTGFLVIPLLAVGVHFHVKELKTIAVYRSSDQANLEIKKMDYKLLLIPVIFIGLRFWSFLGDLLYVYIGVKVKQIPTPLVFLLIVLEGIGDSGQGIVNFIVFILLTRRVRKRFKHCWSRRGRHNNIQQTDEHASLLTKQNDSGDYSDSHCSSISPHTLPSI